MSYIKTTWVTGDIVTAPRMNNMEGGIYNNDAAITELQSEVTDTQSDVSTLQTNVSTMQTNVSTLQSNVSTLQTNVTNLQTITGNLVPSIADVFSTSSTYAVGDHVMYNGRLYECKTAVTSAGAWNASAWEAVSVFKYDDVVGVIKITNTSTTMATIETTLAEINTANDHIVFDVSALSAGMHLCTIYLSDGKYRITDLATGFDGEGLYSGTDTLVSILQKGSAPFYNVSTEPYTFRPINAGIGDKESLDSIVGGSLGWNQLVQNGNFANTSNWTAAYGSFTVSGNVATITATAQWGRISQNVSVLSGHKYLFGADLKGTTNNYAQFGTPQYLSGTSWEHISFLYSATSTTTVQLMIGDKSTSGWQAFNAKNVQVLDLTAMFGSTIADYVYGLGSASGIAWLSKYIDLTSYHAYDAGSIQSVQATAHVTTGFNQFDEVVEAGYWDVTTGQKASGGNWMRCANYIPVLPNTEYKIHFTSGSGSQGSIIYLDGNKSVISYASSYISTVITTPSNCRYMVFYANSGWFGGNICINISKTSGTPKNGDYVPYATYTYPLGSDTLRGIPQLVSNKLQFDGDIKTPDGTIRRKYGIVDLGSLNWTRETSANSGWRFYSIGFNLHKKTGAGVVPNMICPKYITVTANQTWNNVTGISNNGTNPSLTVCDTAYSDAASFKTAMSGVYLVYELETYTTEFLSAYQRVQEAPQGGTEAFTTESIVPVGHSTRNPGNMLAAVELVGDDKEENPIYSEDSTIYTIRKVENRGVAGKCALNKLVGGSLGWNQLVKNGNFSNGTSDWSLGLLTATVSSNVITLTATGTQTAANINQTLSVPSGHKCFVSLSVNPSANNKIRYQLYDGSSFTGTTDITASASTWTAHQNIINCTLNAIQLYIRPNQNGVSGYSCQMKEVQIIDLTAMFGSTIADYVYGLGSTNGIAWLSKYIDLGTYHAYDAGSIQNVQATEHVTLSKNFLKDYVNHASPGVFNGVTFTKNDDGTITLNGTATAATLYYLSGRSVLPDTVGLRLPKGNYILSGTPTGYSSYNLRLGMNRGASGDTIGNDTGSGFAFTEPEGTAVVYGVWIGFNSGAVFNNVVIKPMVRYADADSTYVPYQKHTYPLGSDTLRGYPMLVNNKLAFDGDEKLPDGTIRRKYNTYTATTCTNVGTTTAFGNYAVITDLSDVDRASGVYTPLVCDKYLGVATSGERAPMTAYIVGGGLVIADPSFTDLATARSILASKTPQIVYKTITQTTESSTSFQKIQTIDADGTESFTTSSPVPVGHYTQYAENILAEIDTIGDGLDDIGEEKAVAIPNSAITIVESGASIVENGLHIYKNMVSGWLVIKRGTGYAQTSTHIATIDSRYVPKTRQRMVAGEGYNAYDVQGVAYTTIPPQGSADAGQLWAIQNSTSRPHLFIHLDYTI